MTPEDKQWFVDQFDRLEQRIDDGEHRIRERIDAKLDALEQRLSDRIEATETKLLTAFYKWASATDIKLRHIPEIERRLQLLEERVRDLESGSKPPQ